MFHRKHLSRTRLIHNYGLSCLSSAKKGKIQDTQTLHELDSKKQTDDLSSKNPSNVDMIIENSTTEKPPIDTPQIDTALDKENDINPSRDFKRSRPGFNFRFRNHKI